MELNLRPASVVRRHVLAERRPALVLAGTCLLLTLASFWLYYSRATATTHNALEAIQPKLNELKGFDGRMNAIRSEMKSQQDTAAPLLHAVDERDYWARVINDINSRLPKDYIWITSFQPESLAQNAESATSSKTAKPDPKKSDKAKPTAVLNIKGLYLENPQHAEVVDQFITKLNESEYYSVEPDPGTQVRETPNSETWAYAYAFRLNLKNPISIVPLVKK